MAHSLPGYHAAPSAAPTRIVPAIARVIKSIRWAFEVSRLYRTTGPSVLTEDRLRALTSH
ncbi:hypothetical protein [Marinibacterium profundimaris]|uniref:Uncharacterized protein n=1 Tax=Marinibacterium profundimaris TaxID=1679460 RepID=A0A225NRJ7_9RHOB|nr:hypothetical protein [Marinibacterium profundimaris]OWU77482.1 hypothetical protein ATO3_01905 [Marinibacterium profundimaris]